MAWEVSQGSAGIFAPRASPSLPTLVHKPLALNQLNRTNDLKMAILAHCSVCPRAQPQPLPGSPPRDTGAEGHFSCTLDSRVAPEGRDLLPQDLPKPSFLTEVRQQETSGINIK